MGVSGKTVTTVTTVTVRSARPDHLISYPANPHQGLGLRDSLDGLGATAALDASAGHRAGQAVPQERDPQGVGGRACAERYRWTNAGGPLLRGQIWEY